MDNFALALAAIERLKKDGVGGEYAIGGAMALVFWSEPIPTFDLDVFAEEAIASAAELDYEGQPVRVIRPEYLIALYLEPRARTARRLERVAALLEEASVDRELLDRLVRSHNLKLYDFIGESRSGRRASADRPSATPASPGVEALGKGLESRSLAPPPVNCRQPGKVRKAD